MPANDPLPPYANDNSIPREAGMMARFFITTMLTALVGANAYLALRGSALNGAVVAMMFYMSVEGRR